jgi:hypothetical protein
LVKHGLKVGQIGQKLVKLAKNSPTWLNWSKVGKVGQKLTNLVKLAKGCSS